MGGDCGEDIQNSLYLFLLVKLMEDNGLEKVRGVLPVPFRTYPVKEGVKIAGERWMLITALPSLPAFHNVMRSPLEALRLVAVDRTR